MTAVAIRRTIYERNGEAMDLHFHPGQWKAWNSTKRFIFVLAGTQGGKTSFGPWWLAREIEQRGAGDYIAATSSYDLFKLKMLPEIRNVFENILGIGRYWAGDKIIEIKNPETNEFEAKRADDPMWARIILRSASAEGGLESSTANAAWLDEVGQDDFGLGAWEAVLRRLSLAMGRVLGTTTLYNIGWLKQKVFDLWNRGNPDIDIIQFGSVINPIFPQEEFERAKRDLPDWKFKMQYLGEYDKPAGMIYHDFINNYRENGGHKVKPFQISEKWPRIVGIDPGAVNLGQVWMAHDVINDDYYVYRAFKSGGKSTKEHAHDATRTAAENNERVIAWAIGQKAESQQRMDWESYGVRPVKEPPFHDVESGIDKCIALLRQHRIFFFDNLDEFFDEISTYSRELDDNDEPTEKIKNKQNYHLLDAWRYVTAQVSIEPRKSVSKLGTRGLYADRSRYGN
jgi:hypothetical protein